MADKKDKNSSVTEDEAKPRRSESKTVDTGSESVEVRPEDRKGGKKRESAGEVSETAKDAARAGRKTTRKELIARLLEKNEMILKLNEEKRAHEAEISELKDRWMRTAADFENFRKRSRKEWELLKQQSKTEVILEILGVVDDFERAFSVAEQSESDDFVEGIRLIYNNLRQVLEKLGIREVDALHKPFDPNLHMAVGQVESDDVESGDVAEVIQKGFYLDDTVIRPARVIVAK